MASLPKFCQSLILVTTKNAGLSPKLLIPRPASCKTIRTAFHANPGRALMDSRYHAGRILEYGHSGPILQAAGLGKTKPQVVVPVRRRIPVAVRRAHVGRFIVPGTAAVHPLGSSGTRPLEFYPSKQRFAQTFGFRMPGMACPTLHSRVNVIPVTLKQPVSLCQAL